MQARVETDNVAAVRVARRAGLRNEGVVRVALDLGADDYALLARLRDDPSPTEHGGFRALLNSFLPRKRVIAQALVRDESGRVLMCHPTYKDDWDLPGGVVEVRESPREAAAREVLEELGLPLPLGGWSSRLAAAVGRLGRRAVPGVRRRCPSRLGPRRRRAAGARDPGYRVLLDGEVHARAADYTARRVDAALASLEGTGAAFTESGRTL